MITVAYLGAPDWGAIVTGYIGSALLAGAYLAVTCLTSALTRNQVISFILSVVICFFLILRMGARDAADREHGAQAGELRGELQRHAALPGFPARRD